MGSYWPSVLLFLAASDGPNLSTLQQGIFFIRNAYGFWLAAVLHKWASASLPDDLDLARFEQDRDGAARGIVGECE